MGGTYNIRNEVRGKKEKRWREKKRFTLGFKEREREGGGGNASPNTNNFAVFSTLS